MQAIGATTPFFTALLSYIILREKESVIVYASLAPVVIGIFTPCGYGSLTHYLETSAPGHRGVALQRERIFGSGTCHVNLFLVNVAFRFRHRNSNRRGADVQSNWIPSSCWRHRWSRIQVCTSGHDLPSILAQSIDKPGDL